jgi:DNA helicase-2/ATP-dependent DNA helicase PcrA
MTMMVRRELTDAQRQVVMAEGRVLVTGGPGTGKTTTALTKAAAFLAKQDNTDVEVLFVSFSNAAVQRILSHSRGMLPRADLRRLSVSTFHRVALGIPPLKRTRRYRKTPWVAS